MPRSRPCCCTTRAASFSALVLVNGQVAQRFARLKHFAVCSSLPRSANVEAEFRSAQQRAACLLRLDAHARERTLDQLLGSLRAAIKSTTVASTLQAMRTQMEAALLLQLRAVIRQAATDDFAEPSSSVATPPAGSATAQMSAGELDWNCNKCMPAACFRCVSGRSAPAGKPHLRPTCHSAAT